MKLWLIILTLAVCYLYMDDSKAIEKCTDNGYTLNECKNKLGY